jgi:hypothetical protein
MGARPSPKLLNGSNPIHADLQDTSANFVVSMIAFRGSLLFSLAMGQPTIALHLE